MSSVAETAQLYGTRMRIGNDASAIQGPAGDQYVPARPGGSQQVSSVTAPAVGGMAPAFALVAVFAVLIGIRILHDKGARLD